MTGSALATITEGAARSVAHLSAAPGSVLAIIPQTFDEVYRFAQVLANSGLCPYGMDTPEKVSVAILTGLELGVKPMQAVQGIAVIGGRPCIWGDLSMGLVRANPELEYVVESYEGAEPEDWTVAKPSAEDRKFKAVCRVKRRGQPEVVREFSIGDAVVGKLWQKKNRSGSDTPWITGPKRMLQMRARAFALRDLFTDVLKGLYIAEELIGTDIDNDNEAQGFAGRPALIPGPDAPEDDTAVADAVQTAQASAPRVDLPPVPEKAKPVETAAPAPVEESKIEEALTEEGEQTGNDEFDPIEWTDEAVARFVEAQSAKAVDEVHACFEDTASELPREQAARYQDAHEAAMARFISASPEGSVNLGDVAGPDAPDDDDKDFPGNDALNELRSSQMASGQSSTNDGPQGGDDEEDGDGYEGFTEAGVAFDQSIQAILEEEGRDHNSVALAFNSKLQEMADLMADGDLPPGYDKEIRETFAQEWQRLKNLAKEKVGGTGDAKADALTEKLREGLKAATNTDEMNAFAVSTLPERNVFGSKHPLYAVWQDMIKSRRKALSALASAA